MPAVPRPPRFGAVVPPDATDAVVMRGVPQRKRAIVLEGPYRYRRRGDGLHELPQSALLEGPEILQGEAPRSVRRPDLRRVHRHDGDCFAISRKTLDLKSFSLFMDKNDCANSA